MTKIGYLLILLAIFQQIVWPVSVQANFSKYSVDARGMARLERLSEGRIPYRITFVADGTVVIGSRNFVGKTQGLVTFNPPRMDAHLLVNKTETDVACIPVLSDDDELQVTCTATITPNVARLRVNLKPLRPLLSILEVLGFLSLPP